MSNKKYQSFFLFLFSFFLMNLAEAQTTQWRLIWDKNVDEDTVSYYVVYKNVGSAPSINDSIAKVNHPTSTQQTNVTYPDASINPGVHYFYSVVAVDYKGRRSGFSEVADAAIPRITNLPDSLCLPEDTTVTLNLTSYATDPDDGSSALSWLVNNAKSYTNGPLSISINSSNRATFTTGKDWIGPVILQFSVVDPDTFVDVESFKVSYCARYIEPPDTTDTPGDFEEVNVFPIPFIAGESDGITFNGLPASSSITIFNLMGEIVFEEDNLTNFYIWKVTNNSGSSLNAGLYIYYIKDSNNNKISSGKLIIIR